MRPLRPPVKAVWRGCGLRPRRCSGLYLQVIKEYTPVQAGQPVAIVHAASEASAEQACRDVLAACGWVEIGGEDAAAISSNPVLQLLGD